MNASHKGQAQAHGFTGAPPGTIKVLQITDTHVFADPGTELMGFNTEDLAHQVIARARERHSPADLILATGDLVHDGSRSGYKRIRQRFDELGVPVLHTPGNHDAPEQMAEALIGGSVRSDNTAVVGNWLVVLLNSSLAPEPDGHLAEGELERLRRCLAENPQRPTLIALHHQPVPVGSAWLDAIAVDNGNELMAIVDASPQVRGVVWGHVHQAFDQWRNHVRLLGTPSTCFQFKPHSTSFALDDQPPGYRWLALHPDGEIATGVERLNRVPVYADLQSAGY